MSELNQDDGLSYDGLFSLSWTAFSENDVVDPDHLLQTNLSRLRTIQGLDETGRDLTDEHGELGNELKRIDFKVNVILEMVSQIAAQSISLPEPIQLKLNADSLSWKAQSGTPDVGQRLQLALFLDNRFPFPLLLSGNVVDVTQSWVRLNFDMMDETFQDLFEKFIFRCHRRQVARLKRDENAKNS